MSDRSFLNEKGLSSQVVDVSHASIAAIKKTCRWVEINKHETRAETRCSVGHQMGSRVANGRLENDWRRWTNSSVAARVLYRCCRRKRDERWLGAIV